MEFAEIAELIAGVDPLAPLPEVGLLAGVGAAVIAHGAKSKWLRWAVRACWAGVAAVPWFVAAWAGAVALGVVWALDVLAAALFARRRVEPRGLAVRLLAPPALCAAVWAAARVLAGRVPGVVWAVLAGVVVLAVAVAALRRTSGAVSLPSRSTERGASTRSGQLVTPTPIPRRPKRGEVTDNRYRAQRLNEQQFPGLIGSEREDALPEPRARREKDPVAKWRRKLGGAVAYLGKIGRRFIGLRAEDVSLLVVGPSGSGKTSGVLIPSVIAAPSAVVAMSTKDDIAHAVTPFRAGMGEVVVVDPTGTVDPRSLPPGAILRRWSPISVCDTVAGAKQMAAALIEAALGGDQASNSNYFRGRGLDLLAAALYAAAQKQAGMAEVLSWVQRRDVVPIRDALQGTLGESTLAGELAALGTSTADAEASGMWGSAAAALSPFLLPEVVQAASDPDFDIARFVEGPNTLLLWAEGSAQEHAAPIFAALLEVIAEAQSRRVIAMSREERRETGPMLFVLDELANIAPLRWATLSRWLSDGRDHKIVPLLCLQNLAQARGRWGESGPENVVEACRQILMLPGAKDDLLIRKLAAAGGVTEVESRSESREKGPAAVVAGGRRSETRSLTKEESWPAHRITNGVAGHALHARDGVPQDWVRLTPWFEDRHLRHLQG